jgi:hypothetical protein
LTKSVHLQGLWFFGVRGAALILLVGIFFGGEASADTCSQPQVNCGEAASEDCSADCPVSACWSLEGSCTFEESVAVDPACGCVDPDIGCAVKHGREQSRLYRRTLRRLRSCMLERGGSIESCPDALAERGIDRLRRGVKRRGRQVCGRPEMLCCAVRATRTARLKPSVSTRVLALCSSNGAVSATRSPGQGERMPQILS